MALTVYDIIQGAVVSDKAYQQNKKLKKLVLKIHPRANKPLVKQALEKLFDVKVEKVNCMNRVGKTRMVKRRKIQRSSTKIAIVTLAEGHSLDLFGQTDTTTVVEASKKPELSEKSE